ncbi:XdhC family protein [Limoniibacter endophyticus]|uniref:Xanthine dehydrogenase accessory factor n=1 Tax=Limoniibacter endophyticus TaxID=1565040 RepID=A0A8J3DPS5_9HYPH|nr:XdhC family protein [Limoniibacter endophyticus]GHC71888.1 hypothetical protein GCM10010136_19190 [Limoniibacter endophyticus]
MSMVIAEASPDPVRGRHDGDPLQAALHREESVLAIITEVNGPSYRPLGEIMAFVPDARVGSLSSGCIEADLATHAQDALQNGAKLVRYGDGSPFIDLQLPCGGGLEITLIPRPDRDVLRSVEEKRGRRERCAFLVTNDYRLQETVYGTTGKTRDGFRVSFRPQPRFLIFGSGPEAAIFTDLVKSANYPHLLLSADRETLTSAKANGCAATQLHWAAMPADLPIDDRTAAILFFHDHSWEPTILARLLETPAFYIGAQGSRRAHDGRIAELRRIGVREGLARIKGPIGLIPSARDPRTLAVSVLAEVLDAAR